MFLNVNGAMLRQAVLAKAVLMDRAGCQGYRGLGVGGLFCNAQLHHFNSTIVAAVVVVVVAILERILHVALCLLEGTVANGTLVLDGIATVVFVIAVVVTETVFIAHPFGTKRNGWVLERMLISDNKDGNTQRGVIPVRQDQIDKGNQQSVVSLGRDQKTFPHEPQKIRSVRSSPSFVLACICVFVRTNSVQAQHPRQVICKPQ